MRKGFSIIAAVDKKRGIGKNNKLPWQLKADLAHFAQITVGDGNNAVIMGRSTWESIPEHRRPLEKRLNIVLSRNDMLKVPNGVLRAHSLEEALSMAYERGCEEIFVMGGAKVYETAIVHPACERMYITEVDGIFDCDAFFPRIDSALFKKNSQSAQLRESNLCFCFIEYQKIKKRIKEE